MIGSASAIKAAFSNDLRQPAQVGLCICPLFEPEMHIQLQAKQMLAEAQREIVPAKYGSVGENTMSAQHGEKGKKGNAIRR
jgi:hypothetical protein